MDNDDHTALGALADQLRHHERRSQERYEMLADKLKTQQESIMDGHEKVVINNKYEKEGGGMDGLAPMAAIAALGQRNESGNGLAALAPLLMGNRDGFGGGNFLGAAVGGFVGAAVGGCRRGGLLGGGDDCGGGGAETRIQDNAANLVLLNKLGNLEGAVPLAALSTTNTILEQTIGINGQFANQTAALTSGLINLKDTITTVGAANLQATNNVNQNVLETSCRTLAAIAASETAILSRIDRAEIDQLRHERDRFERGIEINQLRAAQEVSQSVTVTTNQLQAQAQGQQQLQGIINRLDRQDSVLFALHQEARNTAANTNVIAGNTGAVTTTGGATLSPTAVNTAAL